MNNRTRIFILMVAVAAMMPQAAMAAKIVKDTECQAAYEKTRAGCHASSPCASGAAAALNRCISSKNNPFALITVEESDSIPADYQLVSQ